MVFSSIFFLLYFLPVFFVVYQLLWNNDLKNLWILVASIFFYSWGAPVFVFILMGSTIIDFYLVRTMYRSNNPQTKKYLLVSSLVLNLGLLAYFKYANFFVENCNQILEIFGQQTFPWAAVILPIGIRFLYFPDINLFHRYISGRLPTIGSSDGLYVVHYDVSAIDCRPYCSLQFDC